MTTQVTTIRLVMTPQVMVPITLRRIRLFRWEAYRCHKGRLILRHAPDFMTQCLSRVFAQHIDVK